MAVEAMTLQARRMVRVAESPLSLTEVFMTLAEFAGLIIFGGIGAGAVAFGLLFIAFAMIARVK